MAKHPHLYRRQAVYWFRRRPPQALARFFSNREIRLSLRTHFRPEAATRAARLRVVTDLAFRDLERAVTNGLTLPDQTFDQLVTQLVQDELDRCERERELAGPRTEADIQQAVLDHQRQRARLQQALRHNEFGALEAHLASAVEAVQGVATQSDLAVLRRRAVRGLLEATYTNEAREQGLYTHQSSVSHALASGMDTGTKVTGQPYAAGHPERQYPAAPMSSSLRSKGAEPGRPGENVVSLKPGPAVTTTSDRPQDRPAAVNPARSPSGTRPGSVRVSDVIEIFVSKQTKQMQRPFRVAIKFIQEGLDDPEIASLTRESVAEVIELIAQLPKTHGKSARTTLPLRELVAQTNAAEQDAIEAVQLRLAETGADRKTITRASLEARIPRLSPEQSLTNHRRRINAFLRWCHKKGHLPQPLQIDLEDLSSQVCDDARNRDAHRGERLSWGRDQLQKLLTSSIMTAPDKDFGDPLFWSVLAGPHQGTRMEEFLQLNPYDVVVQEGVPVILIRSGLGQHAKTEAAHRIIPIHPVLIEAGFLELVEQRRAEGSHWLFPMLDHGHDGRFSSRFSKRFSRYREDEGLYDPQRDYHSLRKDFNRSLKHAKIPLAARKALMGHKIEDLTDGRYDPEGDSIADKLEYVGMIEFGIEVDRVEGIPVVKLRDTANASEPPAENDSVS